MNSTRSFWRVFKGRSHAALYWCLSKQTFICNEQTNTTEHESRACPERVSRALTLNARKSTSGPPRPQRSGGSDWWWLIVFVQEKCVYTCETFTHTQRERHDMNTHHEKDEPVVLQCSTSAQKHWHRKWTWGSEENHTHCTHNKTQHQGTNIIYTTQRNQVTTAIHRQPHTPRTSQNNTHSLPHWTYVVKHAK